MNFASRAPQMKCDWLDWPFFGESHPGFVGALARFVGSAAIAAAPTATASSSTTSVFGASARGFAAGLLLAAVSAVFASASADLGFAAALGLVSALPPDTSSMRSSGNWLRSPGAPRPTRF